MPKRTRGPVRVQPRRRTRGGVARRERRDRTQLKDALRAVQTREQTSQVLGPVEEVPDVVESVESSNDLDLKHLVQAEQWNPRIRTRSCKETVTEEPSPSRKRSKRVLHEVEALSLSSRRSISPQKGVEDLHSSGSGCPVSKTVCTVQLPKESTVGILFPSRIEPALSTSENYNFSSAILSVNSETDDQDSVSWSHESNVSESFSNRISPEKLTPTPERTQVEVSNPDDDKKQENYEDRSLEATYVPSPIRALARFFDGYIIRRWRGFFGKNPETNS